MNNDHSGIALKDSNGTQKLFIRAEKGDILLGPEVPGMLRIYLTSDGHIQAGGFGKDGELNIKDGNGNKRIYFKARRVLELPSGNLIENIEIGDSKGKSSKCNDKFV